MTEATKLHVLFSWLRDVLEYLEADVDIDVGASGIISVLDLLHVYWFHKVFGSNALKAAELSFQHYKEGLEMYETLTKEKDINT